MIPDRRQTRQSTTLAAPLALAAFLAGLGCDTISEDVGDAFRVFSMPTPREASEMALDQHDADARRRGTLLLANAPFGGNPPYLRMYRSHAEMDPNPLVQAAAIRALARWGDPSDAPLIASKLDHPNVQVRWEAAKGLQRLHEPAVVPSLLSVLDNEEENTDVRVAAATALGQYAQDRVFQGLVAALDARPLAVNLAAQESLRTLTGQTFELEPRAWLAWYGEAEAPFAEQQDFLYPTYQRDESWLEQLVFWDVRVEEQPSLPAGLSSRGERRTYEEGDNDPGGAG